MHHVEVTLRGDEQEQLLMILTGEGGTGKSRMIHAIVEYFQRRGTLDALAMGAYTGITASLIGGKTLHVLFGLTTNRAAMPSPAKIRKLASFWERKKYLIIDKYSMVSRMLLARMSTILSLIYQHNHPTESSSKCWGGMNVIICGDFHQFKPVVQKTTAPLYWPCNAHIDTPEEVTRSEVYQEFKTVICLTHQMHMQDPVWTEFLRYCQQGKCTKDHICML
jgi:hypothetical protein